jgi:hypothetical protein
MKDIENLTQKLERLINTKVAAAGVAEPPRLVRANSAFELYAALSRAKKSPELLKLLDW